MTGNIGSIALKFTLCLVLAVMLVTGARAQSSGSPVSAQVQPAQVTVGDQVTYKVTVNVTGAAQQPTVAVPILDKDTGLSAPVPLGTQTSQQSIVINGSYKTFHTIVYNYSINTSKEGRFTIPPATVTLSGKTYDTVPVEILVQEAPKAQNLPSELEGLVVPPAVRGNPELQRKLTGAIFILPILTNNTPYNGEQVRIAYHLVIDLEALEQAGLTPRVNLDGVEEPAMNDFIKQVLFPFPQEIKFQDRKFGDKVYKVAPIYEAAITSTKTGKLPIENFQISMIFSMRNQRGASPFPDDPFFGSMPFGLGGTGVQVIAQSPKLTLDVKDTPEQGKPAGFSGVVGNYTLTAEVDKKQVRAYDDTVELVLTITGDGNTESFSPPDLPTMAGFTVLGSPEQQVSGRKENDRYISTKKLTYTVRPTTPGNQVIPSITIDTFDPAQSQYVPVSSDPITINVLPGSKPAPKDPAPAANQQDEDSGDAAPPSVQNSDYRYIHTGNFAIAGWSRSLFSSRTAVAFFAIPLGLVGLAMGVHFSRKARSRGAVDKRRQALSASSHHLKLAHQALGAGQIQDMFTELSSGIRQHFAARLGIPVADVTIPELEDRLTERKVPEEIVHGLVDTLETCDRAVFSPVSATPETAKALYRDADQLLKQTEKYL